MSKYRLEDHVRVTRTDHPMSDRVGVVVNVGMIANAYAVEFAASTYVLFAHELTLADPERGHE